MGRHGCHEGDTRVIQEVKAIGDKNSMSRTPERNPGRLVRLRWPDTPACVRRRS